MTKTVHELRNEIRQAVGRFERDVSAGFTKETLAAICEAVDYDVDTNQFPAKAQMRAGILWKIGRLNEDDPDEADRSFRKAELEAIAEAVLDGSDASITRSK
jgi:RecJ-like exonuclease